MKTANKQALFLENGKTKCWVIVMRFKRPAMSKRKKNKEKRSLSSGRAALEKKIGKIVFAIQDNLERHQAYEVMIEGNTYPFILQKIRKKETDNRTFFVAKGRLVL